MKRSEFGIYPVVVGTGHIALSPMPGRFGAYDTDLSAILHWGADMVLTMTTQAELDRMGAADLGSDLKAVDVIWHHLPIVDFGAPDDGVNAQWDDVARQAAALLAKGGKILIHCFGGCGRSGMAALRLMVDAGEDADAALTRLRTARPCAVETDAQFAWAAKPSA